ALYYDLVSVGSSYVLSCFLCSLLTHLLFLYIFFLMTRRPPRSTLFPYTTLFRSMLERIRADAPRKVWTPSDFVDLASRDAVDKALQRLTKVEILRRIDRGLYDQPGFNKLTQKPNPPDPRSVIDAVGRRDQTDRKS